MFDDLSNISDNGPRQLWMNLQVRNLKSIIVCTIYGPPVSLLTCFDTDLSTPSLGSASLLNKAIYILGDGKCNILEPGCREAIALANFCNCFNLSELVLRPTRVTKTTM